MTTRDTVAILRSVLCVRFLRGAFSRHNFRRLLRAYRMRGTTWTLGTGDSDVLEIVRTKLRYFSLTHYLWCEAKRQELDLSQFQLLRAFDEYLRAQRPKDLPGCRFPAQWGRTEKETWLVNELRRAAQAVEAEHDTDWIALMRPPLDLI